jgi:disulfide bond formation protein DsbB
VYSVLLGVVAATGAAIAAWHIRLQNLPPDQVPSCGPGFDYLLDSFPLGEALRLIFTGSGECAAIDWSFLGLSMPAWVLIAVAGIGAFGVWNNLSRAQPA